VYGSAQGGLNWFLNQPIWPVLLVVVIVFVLAGLVQKHDERIKSEERKRVTRDLDPELADQQDRFQQVWDDYEKSPQYKQNQKERRDAAKAEQANRIRAARERRLEVKARCASGVHRPYHPTVWGRKITKCLDCDVRLADDYVEPVADNQA
jgi:hypothetical protein